jgi:gliding motility-associated-like protein
VVLSNVQSNLGVGFVDGNATNTANGTILDDDNIPGVTGISFVDTDVIVTEGTDDFARFTVTMTGAISEDITVDYTTVDGTAVNPDDITAITNTITFTPTVSSVDILVPITDDFVIEPTENFTVVLSNIQSNLGVGFLDGNATNTANGTILDDDEREIMVEPYTEEMTINCGEELPEVPDLVFFNGCGDYVVDFTEVEEFVAGSDDFMIVRTWVVTDQCTNTATFEQVIFVMQVEKELIDIDICIEDDPIDLLSYLPEGWDTNGTFTVLEGDVTLDGSIFDPRDHEVFEEYSIAYEALDTSCKFYADFTINTNKDCLPCDPNNLIISKTITVNGDGVNDYFEITGLEQCNYIYDVMIFNRWGTEVFADSDYRNDWGGYSPEGSFGSKSSVPTGTYYYIITLPGNEIEPINGYIYIGSN